MLCAARTCTAPLTDRPRAHILLAAVVILLALPTACRKLTRDGHRATAVELHVSTDGEFLAFQPTELTCPTRAHVRLVFDHAGQRIPQKHNWVLVLPGAEADVEKAGAFAGEAAGWIPSRDRRIVAATPLCAPGGEAVIEFIAPAPGDYPYICTTPGHAAEMHGVLHVTR